MGQEPAPWCPALSSCKRSSRTEHCSCFPAPCPHFPALCPHFPALCPHFPTLCLSFPPAHRAQSFGDGHGSSMEAVGCSSGGLVGALPTLNHRPSAGVTPGGAAATQCSQSPPTSLWHPWGPGAAPVVGHSGGAEPRAMPPSRARPRLWVRLQQPELSQRGRCQQGTLIQLQEPAGGGTTAAPVGVSRPGELPLGPTRSPGPRGAGGAGRVRHPGRPRCPAQTGIVCPAAGGRPGSGFLTQA